MMSMVLIKRGLQGLLLLHSLVWVAQAHALSMPNYRALLIGVSSYPALANDLQLKGPKNDVLRMQALLTARGFSPRSVQVLADGVDGATLPTRSAILGALKQLADTAKPNDYIVILAGGHGSQMPVPEGHPQADAEPDGLFEIFLPRDVKGWRNRGAKDSGTIENAILDAEFREHIDRMSAAGAFVWAIFDSCHSATMVRSGGSAGQSSEMRLRQVSPAALGVPYSAMARARAQARQRAQLVRQAPLSKAVPSSPSGTPGRAVYFYAAQATEPAPEDNLPYGVPGRQRHGLFSFNLIQTLEAAAGPMTYEQLGQQVLTRYAAVNGEPTATPQFTGTALQAGVLAQSAAPRRQWQLRQSDEGMSIPAGALQQVYEGTVLAVLPDALSDDTQALGYVRVKQSTATTARLVPTAWGGQSRPDAAKLAMGTMGRVVRMGVPPSITVSADLSDCAQPCAFKAPLAYLQRTSTASQQQPNGLSLQWVSPGAGAELVLRAHGTRLWLVGGGLAQAALPPDAEKRYPYLQAGPKANAATIEKQLRQMLHHAGNAIRLLREAMKTSAEAGTTALQVSLSRLSPDGEQPLRPGETVRPGDRLRARFSNQSRSPVDVTAFYLDSKYGIGPLYPQRGASNRLDHEATAVIDIDVNDESLGLERVAVVAVESQEHGERIDLSFLAQDMLASAEVTRSGAALESPNKIPPFTDVRLFPLRVAAP